MKAYLLVTVDQGAEELLGVFTTVDRAAEGCASIAKMRECSTARFIYYPVDMDELTVKK